MGARARTTTDIGRLFWQRVDRSGGCWLWTGTLTPLGYGSQVTYLGMKQYPYRWAYILTHGAIPDGLSIDHMCNNPTCVRPSHLQAVTHAWNQSFKKIDQTHCIHGHEYTEENTVWWRRAEGSWARACRACKLAYQKRLRESRRPASPLRCTSCGHHLRMHGRKGSGHCVVRWPGAGSSCDCGRFSSSEGREADAA